MSTSEARRKVFRSLEARSLRSRSLLAIIADKLNTSSGTPFFLAANVGFFAGWIVVNLGLIPGIAPFDPYPFGFLTMMVSLEAIFLSILVLVSQNRSAMTNTLRDEVSFYINLTAEDEITKALQMLEEIQHKMGIKHKDPELDKMTQNINEYDIERNIMTQIERADKSIRKEFTEELNDVIVGLFKPGSNGNGGNHPSAAPHHATAAKVEAKKAA